MVVLARTIGKATGLIFNLLTPAHPGGCKTAKLQNCKIFQNTYERQVT
ncbi:hypothetical protein SAMN03080599_02847 [Acidaminobacter hydrogenoformans DSM 2784]|uniref:Uncharacterized protein n=1 Tax=Acidaminobacter hydrogenoformans DSM 2784 TaxID=1120920 RepID=A0A1G5S6Q2_9FIRM|nr:hypothetical protein SAMN03080599_02847 [Acidaminobacter hydrogenoformans DSM 2784]